MFTTIYKITIDNGDEGRRSAIQFHCDGIESANNFLNASKDAKEFFDEDYTSPFFSQLIPAIQKSFFRGSYGCEGYKISCQEIQLWVEKD